MDNPENLVGHYIQAWGLSNPIHLAQTATSHVYRVQYLNKDAALKILTPLGQMYEANGAAALRCFDGNGAVPLFRSDDGAHLLSFIDGPPLKHLVTVGRDKEATEIICQVLKKIHSYTGPKPEGLNSMFKHFRALFAKARGEATDSVFNKAVKVAEKLIDSQIDVVLLHGDIHHTNILESSEHGWLAIDPQSLVGERTYDFANSFFNPDDMPSLVETKDRIQSTCGIISKNVNIDRRRILEFAFVHGCLSACWQLEDGENPARRLRIVKLIQELL